MIIRLFVTAWLLALCATPALAGKEVFSFAYLQRENDPAYEQHRVYTGLVLRDRSPPLNGAKTALRESRVLGRSIGVKLELHEATLEATDEVVAAIEALAAEGTRIFLLDLPLEDVKQAAATLAGRDLLLFNIRHGANELRGEDCSSVLFHTIASADMLMDGLAQFLFKKNWTDVLILEGEREADLVVSGAFQQSARKFRLNVVEIRPFVLSNDPRVRDETNIPILTGDADYDVVFLADTLGEWHWTWERYGAPQLNQRFDRIAKRPMKDTDYAAWAAVKSVVEAMVRTGSRDIAVLRDYLTNDAFTLDTYKGAPGNFRSWDNQLRQAVLLHTHNAVIARAPLEGFLHEKNDLDTLGTDAQETECRMD
jgi:ABC-type branched-subunit amino acid transport system substrate-binding protein